ncbi:hypothetical protein NEUTE1DRAFT_39436 [Neurospora tetrasperma FGSC 2508]|uniref:Histone H4 n=1 Tax=Neurospora tetrasperma (strain FGSC 2508 / ATCC MYA-4615 / P0657) TaxID=510951 RepID=F8MGJ5_NEUT8|nr:uncharacterized protein NEUTE1DRAFT_39436 [Neurospora tetrasperma FGSC 2508]EGO59467.1 hypothetical protein NEUTE1DRAFT_39436 [Neurospora tetrasperma FGSC 2508]EGZ73592.1 hypothetical protein NEUTE2DRAFT_62146 [Neurospora tetrasperma FGSC 2509]
MPPTIPSRGGPSGLKHRHSVGGKSVLSGASGKGKGQGGVGIKRHRKIIKDTIRGITHYPQSINNGLLMHPCSVCFSQACYSAYLHTSPPSLQHHQLFPFHKAVQTFSEEAAQAREDGHRNGREKVIFALRRIGKPIYGFDPETWEPPARGAHRRALAQGGEQGRSGNRSGNNDDSD